MPKRREQPSLGLLLSNDSDGPPPPKAGPGFILNELRIDELVKLNRRL